MADDTQDTDYQAQMKQAAANGSFADWVNAYRARNAAMPSSINGMPPEQALAPAEAQAASPAGPPPPMAPVSTGSPAQAIADIQSRIAGGQPRTTPEGYDQFLQEKGINPNTIGGAEMVGPKFNEDGSIASRKLVVPTIQQEQDAIYLANQLHAQEGRAHYAAAMAARYGQPQVYQSIIDNLSRDRRVRNTGNSYEALRDYFLGRFRSNSPYQNFYTQVGNTNGYAQ